MTQMTRAACRPGPESIPWQLRARRTGLFSTPDGMSRFPGMLPLPCTDKVTPSHYRPRFLEEEAVDGEREKGADTSKSL